MVQVTANRSCSRELLVRKWQTNAGTKERPGPAATHTQPHSRRTFSPVIRARCVKSRSTWEHRCIAPQCADGNQAVNARPNRDRGTSGVAVQLHRVVKNAVSEWVFENRDVRERRYGNVEGSLVVDSLKYFLHDWQARHDLIASHRLGILAASTAAKYLDPRAGVHKNHRRRLPPAAACSRSDTH